MEHNAFKEDEIPYGILSQFGLTREMIEDLPMEPFTDILQGRRSPVLPVMVTDEDGRSVRCRTRLKLYRRDDGSVDVLFHPRLQRSELDRYTEEERQALLSGKAIVSHSPDDEAVKCFVQVDRETLQVMYVPTPVIGRNLRSMMDNFSMTSAQIQSVQEGDTVTFLDRDGTVTVGIDLSEKTGIRMVAGDARRWQDMRTDGLDRYNFGIFGCWVRDDLGNLDYIHEDDYTDMIWEEQKNAIARNSGMKR